MTGETADKAQAKDVVRESVNYLGSYGSGKKFDEPSFNTKFNMANAYGGGLSKSSVQVIVTAMVGGV